MKQSFRTTLAATAAAMTVAVALPTAPAYAINKVPCDESEEWLSIRNNNGPGVDEHCYANEGVEGVAIYGVTHIWSGNNRAVIHYIRHLGEAVTSMTLEKGSSFDDPGDPLHMVYMINILPE